MKKILIILVLAFMTGCINKKSNELTCNITQNTSDNITKQSIISTFSNENVKKISLNIETNLSDTYSNYIDLFLEKVSNNFADYQDKTGIDMKVKKSEQNIIFEMNIDVPSLDEDSKKILELLDVRSTYKATKKSLESMGYLCK